MAHLLMFSLFLYMESFLSYIQLCEISEIGAMSDPKAGYPTWFTVMVFICLGNSLLISSFISSLSIFMLSGLYPTDLYKLSYLFEENVRNIICTNMSIRSNWMSIIRFCHLSSLFLQFSIIIQRYDFGHLDIMNPVVIFHQTSYCIVIDVFAQNFHITIHYQCRLVIPL